MGDREITEPSGAAAKVIYSSETGAILKILVANAALNLITLGTYRFWGKTRIRRYIWSRLSYLDEPFEYSGTAKELFVGFLIVLAVLAPILILKGILEFTVFDSVFGSVDSFGATAVDTASAIIFIILFQFALFRARRYRLTRTRWRGIVGGLSGSAARYGIMAAAYFFVLGLTFGLAYPLMSTALERYKVGNTWLGNAQFEFTGLAGALFWRWLLCWVLLIPTLGLAYFWYRAAELRYFSAQTKLNGLTFTSRITGGRLFLIYLVYFLALVVPMLLLGIIFLAGFSGVEMDLDDLASGAAKVAYIPLVLGVVFLLLSSVIYTWLVTSRLLRAFCDTLEIHGALDFSALAQGDASAPTRGEGLADALDIGGL